MTARNAGLLAVVAIAGALRFAHLDRQGLLLFDEGQLILEAREAASIARAFPPAVAGRPGAREALSARVAQGRIAFGKPAHNALLAAALPFFPRADRATLFLSAAAGTLAVLAAWWFASPLYGGTVALGAALLLALSPYHILYSREGLSDALTVLFWTVALGFAVRPGRRAAFWSGALAALAAATNYRTLFAPVILAWAARDMPDRRGRLAAGIAGFAVPLVAFEAAYRMVLAAAGGAVFPGGTYWGQLAELLSFHGAQGFRFAGWPAFWDHFARWEGALSLAVLVAVLPFQLARWRGADGKVNVAMLAPWLLFSAYWDNASRFFALLLPLVAVVKARWLLSLGSLAASRIPRLPAASFLLLAAAALVPPALRLVPRPAPYLDAMEVLGRSGDPRHVSTNSRLGLAYAGPGGSVQVPADIAGLNRLEREGWRWAVTDLQAFFGGFDRPEDRLATTVRIAETRPSVLDIPYGDLALAQFVLEQDLSHADARALLEELRALGPRLRVYDLRKRR